MKYSVFFKTDKISNAIYEELSAKHTVALALLLFLKRNTEDCYSGQYIVTEFAVLKKFLKKEKDTVRKAINTLKELGAIEASGSSASKLEFKINI